MFEYVVVIFVSLFTCVRAGWLMFRTHIIWDDLIRLTLFNNKKFPSTVSDISFGLIFMKYYCPNICEFSPWYSCNDQLNYSLNNSELYWRNSSWHILSCSVTIRVYSSNKSQCTLDYQVLHTQNLESSCLVVASIGDSDKKFTSYFLPSRAPAAKNIFKPVLETAHVHTTSVSWILVRTSCSIREI